MAKSTGRSGAPGSIPEGEFVETESPYEEIDITPVATRAAERLGIDTDGLDEEDVRFALEQYDWERGEA